MALQIMSDLHLETPKQYDQFEIKSCAPYLALLGDIGNIVKDKTDCLAFLRRQVQNFRVVLFVPGNHEAYHASWHDTLSILKDFEQECANDKTVGDFILLDRRVYHIPDSDVIVLGCSLFSHVPDSSAMTVETRLNDFYTTDGWNVPLHNEAHRRDLAWLNEQVEDLKASSKDVFILTHWSPSTDTRAIDPKHGVNPIGCAFCTELSGETCFLQSNVKLWAFGHTHYNCDFHVEREGNDVDAIRLMTNQRGYYFAQSPGFNMAKSVVLSSQWT